MKKPTTYFTLIVFLCIFIFSSCVSIENQSSETENKISESITNIEETTKSVIVETEGSESIPDSETITNIPVDNNIDNTNNTEDPIDNTFKIVDTVKYRTPGEEIPSALLGKYVCVWDEGSYFELKSDGTVFISLNAMSGYAKYNSSSVSIKTMYVEDGRMSLLFYISAGQYTFPAGVIAEEFFCDDFNSDIPAFECLTYLADVYNKNMFKKVIEN